MSFKEVVDFIGIYGVSMFQDPQSENQREEQLVLFKQGPTDVLIHLESEVVYDVLHSFAEHFALFRVQQRVVVEFDKPV